MGVQQRFDNVYLYGAIAVGSGKCLFGLAKTMTGDVFGEFMSQCGARNPETLNVLLDNSATQKAKTLVVPLVVSRFLYHPVLESAVGSQ